MNKTSSILALFALVFTGQAVAVKPQKLSLSQSEQFPYSMVGQLYYTSGRVDYQASGTLIHQRSVLTAAHNLWDEFGGFSVSIEFNRGRHGAEALSHDIPTRKFIFAGYRAAVVERGIAPNLAFARDLGGLRFASAIADGSYVGWKAQPTLLTGDTQPLAVGYGAEIHSGDEPLAVEPMSAFEPVKGAYLETVGTRFESGMSGGPVLVEEGNEWRVVGVIVSGREAPEPAGGVRALNSTSSVFIRKYLTY